MRAGAGAETEAALEVGVEFDLTERAEVYRVTRDIPGPVLPESANLAGLWSLRRLGAAVDEPPLRSRVRSSASSPEPAVR